MNRKNIKLFLIPANALIKFTKSVFSYFSQNYGIEFKKFLYLIFLLVTLLFSLSISQAQAATIYVDNTTTNCSAPSDTDYDPVTDTCGSGSYTVYNTIQGAADVVNPGDTVIVKDGTYTDTDTDNIVLLLKRSGDASNWITFQSENQYGAVLDGQNNTTGACINTNAYVHHVIIDGFEIKGCKDDGITTNNGAHHIQVLNNDIHDISVYCGSETTDNPSGMGICLGSESSYPSYDWIMSGNKIHNIGRPTYCQVFLSYSTNGEYAAYFGGYNMTFTNNIIYDNYAGWSIHIAKTCGSANDGDNLIISNNTIYGYDPNHDSHLVLFKKCSGQFSNVKIQNNISHSPTGGAFTRTKGGVLSGISFLNNLVYGGVVRTSYEPGFVPDAESGNITEKDPKFTNLSGRNFHLQATSPAINAGLATNAPSTDLYGNTRPQGSAYDIGAYEYVGTSPDTTPPASPTGLTVL